MVKNEKFQCPSERGGPEDFKNHPTFVSSAFLGGVMASQTWEHFFGTPCIVAFEMIYGYCFHEDRNHKAEQDTYFDLVVGLPFFSVTLSNT